MPRHLILIGLPGVGKTTIGHLVADQLDTHCTDIDPIIERATGMTIAELFGEEGEATFRAREHLAVLQSLGLPPHVVTPGGGWAVQPGNLDEVADRAWVIHLAVDPAVAAARLGAEARLRPLLAADPVRRLETLATERAPWYRKAHATVDVSQQTAQAAAAAVLELARTQADWP
ncbi:MAG: shikimate kinase [Gemmatimonadetes bacterium]|nr:shikimate kinase [Gemmatimonadota bacterium]